MAGAPDPKPARPSDESTREQRLEFRVAVLALDAGCVAASPASPCEGNLQAHHAIDQQRLRALGLADYLWDPSVGMAVCERHHRRHHNRREPIPLSAIPSRVRSFAAGIGFGLDEYLRRRYD